MNAPRSFFIAGTDTEIGKTFTTALLLRSARLAGLTALGMKPVAAGVDANGRNDDVEAILAASSFQPPREDVNPFLYRAPVSPHIAARDEGRPVDLATIAAAYRRLAAQADLVLVEGVGGFLAPLSDTQDGADLARALGLPVILVVGLRLGCLNHALLTAEAIAARGLPLAGWIGNHVDPAMARQEDNVRYLRDRLHNAFGLPCLGLAPHLAEPAGPAREARLDIIARTLRLPGQP